MSVTNDIEFRSEEIICIFKQLIGLEEWIMRYEKYFELKIKTLEKTSDNKELIANMRLVKSLFTILKTEVDGVYASLINLLTVVLK